MERGTDFLKYQDSDNDTVYYKLKEMNNGQTAMVCFIESETKKRTLYFVAFAIANKKKDVMGWIKGDRNNIELKVTGKCGIESLLWAKSEIAEFENWILTKDSNKPITICVGWADNRRRNVYEYGLKKMGYIMGPIFGSKYLYKQIR